MCSLDISQYPCVEVYENETCYSDFVKIKKINYLFGFTRICLLPLPYIFAKHFLLRMILFLIKFIILDKNIITTLIFCAVVIFISNFDIMNPETFLTLIHILFVIYLMVRIDIVLDTLFELSIFDITVSFIPIIYFLFAFVINFVF